MFDVRNRLCAKTIIIIIVKRRRRRQRLQFSAAMPFDADAEQSRAKYVEWISAKWGNAIN